MVKIKYAERSAPDRAGSLVRVFRGFILVGVWILVGLAGFAAWMRLAT